MQYIYFHFSTRISLRLFICYILYTTVPNLPYTEWLGVNKVNLNTRRTGSDIIINISM